MEQPTEQKQPIQFDFAEIAIKAIIISILVFAGDALIRTILAKRLIQYERLDNCIPVFNTKSSSYAK